MLDDKQVDCLLWKLNSIAESCARRAIYYRGSVFTGLFHDAEAHKVAYIDAMDMIIENDSRYSALEEAIPRKIWIVDRICSHCRKRMCTDGTVKWCPTCAPELGTPNSEVPR